METRSSTHNPDLRETTRRLQSLLRAAGRAALVSTAVAGCADGDEEEAAWTPLACDTTGLLAPDALRPARTVDFVSLEEHQGDAVRSPLEQSPRTLMRVGERCATAPDRTACAVALEAQRMAQACAQPPCRYALIGEGPIMQRVDGRDALLAVLGSIDAVSEALLLAGFSGQELTCSAGDRHTLYRSTSRGYELTSEWDDCETGRYRQQSQVSTSGEVLTGRRVMLGSNQCVVGRRPAGLCEAAAGTAARTALGSFIAQGARLEAASIFAFRQLVHELTALAAPAPLVAASRAALMDELRHAATLVRVARRFGAEVAVPEVRDLAPRSPFEIARDNAREGCVRETFGALVATHQAAHARDLAYRRIMRTIARDETRHAGFSWALRAWLDSQLSGWERALVRAEQAQAMERLRGELDVGLSPSACDFLGYPDVALSTRLHTQLSGVLAAVA